MDCVKRAGVLGILAVTMAVYGQGDDPAFEVVSIKPKGEAVMTGPGPGMTIGLRYSGTHVSGNAQIFSMILDAYSLKPFQVAGPDWIRTNIYEFAATMPEGGTRETSRGMLRRALAERFLLRFHRESRDVPVYALSVAKDGFKLEGVDPERAKEREIDTPWGLRKGVTQMGQRGLYIATAASMTDFADWMSNMLGRPVLDQTSLAGHYAIDLRWQPEEPLEMISVAQRKLGVKFESKKAPFEILIVDHIEKVPTAN
jgi:uncharacterized protein (TIGR03435 family)